MTILKKFNLYSVVAILATALCITAAHAEREIGSGGDGVLRGSRVYSLDLVEAGAETNPSLPDLENADRDIIDALRAALDETKFPIQEIAAKITEIKALHPLYAWALMRGIGGMNWAVVDPSLINVRDEETVVNIPPGRLVQVAVRRNGVVRINRRWWSLMDRPNKAALVFHEVNYAYMKPEAVTRRSEGWQQCYSACGASETCRASCLTTHQETVARQESFPARDLTGYLFQRSLLQQGQDALYRRIPVSSYLTDARLAEQSYYSVSAINLRQDVIDSPDQLILRSTYSHSVNQINRTALTETYIQSYCQDNHGHASNSEGIYARLSIQIPRLRVGLADGLYLVPEFPELSNRLISSSRQMTLVDACVNALTSMKEAL